LILKYIGGKEIFSLTNFIIIGGDNCSAPLKDGILYITDNKPNKETLLEFKNFTKENFEKEINIKKDNNNIIENIFVFFINY
jgi:hypothetical protein